MMVRRLHHTFALIIAAFLVLHLANQVAGLFGQDMHRAVQEILRPLYRNGLIEPLLLTLLVVQIGLGLAMARRRRRITLQIAAGLYLAVFVLVHVGAVLTARWMDIDTDLAFAAAGLHAGQPWPLLFGAYYGLGVISIFIHLSALLRRRAGREASAAAIIFGTTLAVALVMLLAGWVTPLSIPEPLITAFP